MISILVLVLTAAPGPRQSTPAAAKARVLAQMIMPPAMWSDRIRTGCLAQADLFAKAAPKLGNREEIAARLLPVFEHMFPYDEMLDLEQGLLIKYYSAEELDQVIQFYRSPIGAKTLRVMPEAYKDLTAAWTSTMQANLPAFAKALDGKNENREKSDHKSK